MVSSYITSSYRISHIHGFLLCCKPIICFLAEIEFKIKKFFETSKTKTKKELSYSDQIIYTQFDPPHLYPIFFYLVVFFLNSILVNH